MPIEASPSEPGISRRSFLQRTLLAQVISRNKSKNAYLAQWDAWAKQPNQNPGENRKEAVKRMKAWLKAGDPGMTLDLNMLELTSLPENLPPSLQKLHVSRNQLTLLPENLPASLQELRASDNQLTHLPENLPASLRELLVSHNRLTSLPESLPTSSLHELHVDYNRLPQRVCQNLNTIFNAPGGNRGTRIYFSMAQDSSDAPARPLEDAVSDWHRPGKEEVREKAKKTWSAFQEEEGAEEFSRFLDRLRDTVNYGNPQFRQSVVAWLSHLADHPELRKGTFLVSVGATQSCEDRVSLTYNEMKKVRVAFDVENGRYDDRLGDLVQVARGMYRLDQLEKIAREKVNSLFFVDEIEVYLAYQVKLREQLNLPLDTPDMRFFGVSWVTADDLTKAEQRVKEAEDQEFVHYLSTRWQPWQSVLSRLHGEPYEEAQEKLIDAMGEEFQKRLNARLEESRLQNDDDALRIVGVKVKAEIESEIKEPLTREFLNAHNLLHLLDHQWQLS